MTYKWKLLAGRRGGLWFFLDELSNRVSVADNSGEFPHLTDDGVLWINTSYPITFDSKNNCYTLPVTDKDGGDCGCLCDTGSNGEFALNLWLENGGKIPPADVDRIMAKQLAAALRDLISASEHANEVLSRYEGARR